MSILLVLTALFVFTLASHPGQGAKLVQAPVERNLCIYQVNVTNIRSTTPLFYSKDNLLIEPSQDPETKQWVIRIPTGKQFTIKCPGPGNYIKGLNKEEILIECGVENSALLEDGTIVEHIQDLKCTRANGPEIINTLIPCEGSQTTIVQIVHNFGTARQLLYKICFHLHREITLYTYHELQWNTIPDQPGDYGGNWYDGNGGTNTSGLFLSMNPRVTTAYQKQDQYDYIARQVGDNHLYVNVGNNPVLDFEMYMARGHLVPNADYDGFHSRGSTYFYGNAHPQWQNINNGNWKQMEAYIQSLKPRYDLTIYTGTLEQVNLARLSNNQPTPIWLSGFVGGPEAQKLPVPLYSWKIVYGTPTNVNPPIELRLAFITINNPHIPSAPSTIENCPCRREVCNQFNLSSDVKKGVTYCCEGNKSLEDFRAWLPYRGLAALDY